MKRYFPTLFLLISFCLSITLAPSLQATAQQANAQTNNRTLNLAGLRERVTVRRDERSIPHIEAMNELDLYFAQGYVTASDRLWQMDLMRRSARGELSEIFGKDALEEDKAHRRYGFAGVCETEAAQATPQARAGLEAYARGVNAYMESLDAKSLPPEFQILQYKPRAWTPSDSLLIVKLFAEDLNSTWETDIMREALAGLPAEKRAALFPETSPLDVPVVGKDHAPQKTSTTNTRTRSFAFNSSSISDEKIALLQSLAEIRETSQRSLERIGLYMEDRAVSNNWVVSGKRTASGKPLLANDPHLSASAPSIWYMVDLSAPGLHVAGVVAPGLPGVIIGHNSSIAWGFTNVGPDVQDLYLEKFDTANPRRYMTPQGWRDAEVRHEEIRVRKGFMDSATDTVPLDVTVTRHGPIIFEKDTRRYALRWTTLDPKQNDAEGFGPLNRARNWKEFQAALGIYTGPMQNMVYADVDGHIGYYAAGRVPVRKSGDGSVPYDGATDAGEWTSYIPFDKLPHLFDPPSGMIVTANQRIVGQDYPYFLTREWPAPYRAHRINELLQTKKEKLTADDIRAIQGDIYSIAGATFARETVKLAHGLVPSAGDEKWTETIKLLDSWDGRMSADSRAAVLVSFMRSAFRRRIFTEALGADLAKQYFWPNSDTLVDRIITEHPKEWLPKEFKDYAELLRACEKESREALAKRLGADDTQWTWGKIALVSFPHPLARAPLIGGQFLITPFPQNGTGGSLATVNVGRSVSMRFIADPGDWDKTQHGIALGESGLPTSPHWKDQLDDWRNVTPRAFPFTSAAVAKATQETWTLMPAK